MMKCKATRSTPCGRSRPEGDRDGDALGGRASCSGARSWMASQTFFELVRHHLPFRPRCKLPLRIAATNGKSASCCRRPAGCR